MIQQKSLNNQQKLYVLGLFLITILLTQISLPFIPIGSLPDYFIACAVALISVNNKYFSVMKIFFLGLVADILIGQLIGQYGFTFLLIYVLHFFISKMLAIQSNGQKTVLGVILVLSGLLIDYMTSATYEIDNYETSALLKIIFTIITFLIYRLIFEMKLKAI